MTHWVPWGQQRASGAGGSGRWRCCRASKKLGDDQEAWASLGSEVNRDACHNGSHRAGLLVIGTGLGDLRRWAASWRGWGSHGEPWGHEGLPLSPAMESLGQQWAACVHGSARIIPLWAFPRISCVPQKLYFNDCNDLAIWMHHNLFNQSQMAWCLGKRNPLTTALNVRGTSCMWPEWRYLLGQAGKTID